jgi:hypothetical protein
MITPICVLILDTNTNTTADLTGTAVKGGLNGGPGGKGGGGRGSGERKGGDAEGGVRYMMAKRYNERGELRCLICIFMSSPSLIIQSVA